MNEIIAIVVTYNRKLLLQENIISLLNQTLTHFDILIIDNNSSDGTSELIKEYLDNPRIKYYNTQKNIGGAGGFYTGIKIAYEKGYKFFWIMDDDTIPEKSSLENLIYIDKKLNGNYGFLGSYVKWVDGSYCIMNTPSISAQWKENIDLVKDMALRVDNLSFVSLFIKADVIGQVGYPLKEFFIWGDDIEYTERISKIYPCFLVLNSVVVHKMNVNMPTNIIDDLPQRLPRYKYLFRNIFYMSKNKGFKSVIKYLYDNFKLIKDILKSPNKFKLKKIKVIIYGLLLGVVFNPKIEKPRKEYFND